tara:strand:- start:1402 stop:1578 length:177 start_codon:yes stop_codon:yes gene_type:complete
MIRGEDIDHFHEKELEREEVTVRLELYPGTEFLMIDTVWGGDGLGRHQERQQRLRECV